MSLCSVDKTGEEALRLHRSAIAAARDAGVGRILYTSHMGANLRSAFAPMPDHAATERMLQESGVPFTSLRHGSYAASALQLIAQGLETGVIAMPEDGRSAGRRMGQLLGRPPTSMRDVLRARLEAQSARAERNNPARET